MSEHALQQVEKLVDKLDRIADAALRASRTNTNVRDLQTLKRDLAVIKTALRSAPAPAPESKPGQGKNPVIIVGGVALTAAEVALLALLAALAIAYCISILAVVNQTTIEDSAADVWDAATALSAGFAITLALVRERVVTQVDRVVPVGHPCRPDYDCAFAAMQSIGRINSLDITDMYRDPPLRWRETAESFILMLETCLGSLIRCIDPDDTQGWWQRLVGPDGVITRTVTRWRNWTPTARIPRPGGG